MQSLCELVEESEAAPTMRRRRRDDACGCSCLSEAVHVGLLSMPNELGRRNYMAD